MAEHIKGDVSLTVTINLPDEGFEDHAKHILGLLDKAGYEAYPMSAQWILDQADQIRQMMSPKTGDNL